MDAEFQKMGNELYPLIHEKYPTLCGKLTGMFVRPGEKDNEFEEMKEFFETDAKKREHQKKYILRLINDSEFLHQQLLEAVRVLQQHMMLDSRAQLRPSSFERVAASVKQKFQLLRFRRVETIHARDSHYWLIYPERPPQRVASRANRSVWKQYGEERAVYFYGTTAPYSLRDEDNFKGHRLPFSRSGYGVLNPVTLDFEHTDTQIVPQVGDLLCGTVEVEHSEPFFVRWFICSEQFYRCWTLCLHPDHESFSRVKTTKKSPREYWMSGNRLMTNSYLKWCLAYGNLGIPVSHEQRIQRYWQLRTEPLSVHWVHVYCALVLMIRYHEVPDESNVPQNKGGVPYPHWHLPRFWVADFIKHHT